ncbi:hypothetical protein DYI37_00910 [Fulvimarina endophytica]|uniref:Glycosyl transferase family 25 domain-containing protein n=1 Tax=Fulvimarina endophytica TaxID=2293836 RepID=A0A371XAJ5_9HYPH|nr:glycosyltransferase family 25 protein [Fulvimarina endophytica]RFC66064.1 hypothetical protein DYI37_00910 [Fulvimarina endophytica]
MIAASYINLDRAAERRAFMERQAQRVGLKLERFPAVSADDVGEARFAALSNRWERPLARVEIALLLSHASLWRKAVETDAPLAVFEDDALLSPRLPEFLSRDLRGYDLINLEYCGRRKFFRRYAGAGDLIDVVRDKSGSGAYVVSPQGAGKLLAALETASGPSDAFMFAFGRVEIAQVEPALAIQAVVLEAEGRDPGIETTRQIHQPPPAAMSKPENWIFAWRRFLTQLRFVPLHLGRGSFYEFRKPRIDLSEFSADE